MLKVTFLLIVEGEEADGKEVGSTFSFSSPDFRFVFPESLSFVVMLISYPCLVSEKIDQLKVGELALISMKY